MISYSNSNNRLLSLSAPTFAKLSPSAYLQAYLLKPSGNRHNILRPNRRGLLEVRPLSVHTGSLSHACGSAVVRAGDTAVVCGVRPEVLYLNDEPNNGALNKEPLYDLSSADSGTRRVSFQRQGVNHLTDLNLLVPNIELGTGCTPSHLPNNPPSTFAQCLSHRISMLLSDSDMIPLEDLLIFDYEKSEAVVEDRQEAKGKSVPSISAFWTLYIDILFISLDGNAFDTAWAAVVAALIDTRLPKAWFDSDTENVLCSNLRSEAKPLRLRTYPVSTTLAIFQLKKATDACIENWGRGKWLLADPDDFEEELSYQTVTMVVAGHDNLIKFECEGLGILTLSEMKHMTQLAEQRWEVATDVLGVAARTQG